MTSSRKRFRVSPLALCACAALLAACSSSDERDGRGLPPSEVAAVRGQVDAALERVHGRLGAVLALADLGRRPRTLATLQRLGFIEPDAGPARTYTPAAFAAGRRVDDRTIAFDLAGERFAGIRSVTITTPGLGQAGARQYVVLLRVEPLPSPLAERLARAGALACAGLGGERLPLRAKTIVPAIFYTAYDPAQPNAGQLRAGLAGTIRPDCPLLR